MNRFKELFKPGIIVSCQAYEGEPLYSPEGGIMPLMAKAGEMSGAVGIRANGTRDVRQISEVVSLPIIAILKHAYQDSPIYITSTLEDVDELMTLDCVKCVAIQCTKEVRHNNESMQVMIKNVKAKYPNLVIMADISDFEEGMAAVEAGVDAVSTTMHGYTAHTKGMELPGIELVRQLNEALASTDIPVMAEGGIYSEEHITKLIEAGAYGCIIGGAITRPQEIAKRFVGWYNNVSK